MSDQPVNQSVEIALRELGPAIRTLALNLSRNILNNQTKPLDPIVLLKTEVCAQLFARSCFEALEESNKVYRAAATKAKDIAADAVTKFAAAEFAEMEARAELRRVKELRGEYESKRVAELEAQLRTRDRELEIARAEIVRQDGVIAQLTAEASGRRAAISGYERDLAHLMTASAKNAAITRAAHDKLREAVADLAERYPKPTPFIAAILAELRDATALLGPAKAQVRIIQNSEPPRAAVG